MPVSRFQELYPIHTCQECDLEHVSIPRLSAVAPGEDAPSPLLPYEVRALVEGSAHPGKSLSPSVDTPAHVYALLWGVVGSDRATLPSTLFMN
ncbi:hypothetical protein LCGC14_0288940 [marine sediment metagenome]|uniref:Uncharacterized protein n=1 Tax=marine sediment metagenome TaxID=412755 RepID=A0A0F9UAQ3_9ZZZZ